eukprot:scaffold40390_cov26-Tisochrysis_lutea.AAC.1
MAPSATSRKASGEAEVEGAWRSSVKAASTLRGSAELRSERRPSSRAIDEQLGDAAAVQGRKQGR